MKSVAVSERQQSRARVSADEFRVGKDVIELLTSGMYVSPITIYREYVQNAADAIDLARRHGQLGATERGKVTIKVDQLSRSISIRDNGSGIGYRDAVQALLAIGGSSKRGTQYRGFRGVGRLAGLAYCRTLEFRTKTSGENIVASIAWDCQALRSKLFDNSFHGDLEQIVCDAVSIQYEESKDENERFFEVHLRDVVRLRNDLLLNERMIAQYLAQVGPVPFASDFSFASLIEDRLAKHGDRIPLDLTVAGEAVCRPYRDETVLPGALQKIKVEEIEFTDYVNIDGDVCAIGWTGHHQYIRSIPIGLGIRGLRARMGDMQIGEANIFDESFKEPRFNGWAIGEIHIFDSRIVPNARRDNFENNHHFFNLLAQIGPVAARLSQRCRTASISRNATQNVLNVVREVSARLSEGRHLDPAELSRLKSSILRARTQIKRIDLSVRDFLTSELDVVEASLAECKPVEGASVVALDEVVALISRMVSNRQQARELVKQLRMMCG